MKTMYSPFADYEIIQIDLHGMSEHDAKEYVYYTIETAPKTIREIIVIHGYHNGTRLQHLVRHEIRTKRKVKVIIGQNQGATYLDFVN